MERRWMDAPRRSRAREAALGPLCRDFARGSCPWGRSCRFSHDRNAVQICRYFKRGFCLYGEQCSYRHIQKEPARTRHGPAPTRRRRRRRRRGGPEPSTVPMAVAQGSVGAPSTLACPAPSVAQPPFTFPNVEAELEENDRNIPAPDNIPRGASGGEFVPIGAQSASGSQLQGLALDPDSSDPGQAGEETVTWTDPAEVPVELDAGAALVPIEVLRARSEAVVCGICMDRVYEKPQPKERVFGILPNCNHAYCLGCIRKWRRSQGFQSAVVKACPECRVTSNYYIPHEYWVSDAGEKENLIKTFMARTGQIRCKFFEQYNGCCPFKSDCIYLHELPTGEQEYSSSPSVHFDDEEDEDVSLYEWGFGLSELEMECDYESYVRNMLSFDFNDSD